MFLSLQSLNCHFTRLLSSPYNGKVALERFGGVFVGFGGLFLLVGVCWGFFSFLFVLLFFFVCFFVSIFV